MSGNIGGTWPQAGTVVLKELAANRGRLALVAGSRDGVAWLASKLSADLDLSSVSLGSATSHLGTPPTESQLYDMAGSADMVTDLDLLAWPALQLNPLAFLIRLARRRPTLAVWPGDVLEQRARYSETGRPDHLDERLYDAIVLRPRQTRYPDEVPFTIERIAR